MDVTFNEDDTIDLGHDPCECGGCAASRGPGCDTAPRSCKRLVLHSLRSLFPPLLLSSRPASPQKLSPEQEIKMLKQKIGHLAAEKKMLEKKLAAAEEQAAEAVNSASSGRDSGVKRGRSRAPTAIFLTAPPAAVIAGVWRLVGGAEKGNRRPQGASPAAPCPALVSSFDVQ